MKILDSIQLKLLTIIAIASLGVIFVGLLSVFSLRRITDNFSNYIDASTSKVQSIQKALISLENANSSLAFALSYENLENLDDINRNESDFNHAILQYSVFVNALIWGSASEEFQNQDGGIIYSEWKRMEIPKDFLVPPADEKEKKTVEELGTSITPFVTDAQKIFSLKRKILRQSSTVQQGDIDKSKTELASLVLSLKTSRENISKLIETYISQTDVVMKTEIEQQNKFTKSLYQLIFTFIGLNLLAVVIISTYITRFLILIPIQQLTKVVNDISTGKLDSKIDPRLLESKGEIGDLARAFDRTVVSLKLAMREKGQTGQSDTSTTKEAT
ncbi:hypothetical protein A2Z00_02065 [Candidatus Gottesmanbacteria bacterium RBG_13_45_10]|uniref:HAMP domain-containing protein n=1 Tax=Candidatus Gottesmanbacteria bacterium RBG_13_45_10 TaxID=1798370 RepID=A0A1F5ZHJ9_9BACT|nr:MAG: hypothetical protein A2Z00_02065 [Candidatus Gottesmanbacteria bacterium RBG_13_45_10]